MAINYGRKFFERVLIFRPHNVYGPDMGWEHVIPQFAHAAQGRCAAKHTVGKLPFEIQGNGSQTRSFCHVDDLVAGVHGDARQRRASRHLSCRHDRRDHDRRPRLARSPPMAGREIELIARPGAGRRHRAPLPGHRQARQARLRAAAAAGTGAAADRRLVLGQRTPRVAELINYIKSDLQEILLCFRQKLLAPPGAAEVSRSNAARSAATSRSRPCYRSATCRRSTRWSQIGAVQRQQTWFPTNLMHCPNCELVQLGLAVDPVDHLSAGISLHQRHDPDSARQFRGSLCRILENARPRQRRSGRSTSAPMTAP